MSAKRILVLGGGFAGLWSAVGAIRKLDELGYGPNAVAVTLVNRYAFHSIRVRNYEADLSNTRVPLADLLDPICVKLVVAEISDISIADRTVTCVASGCRPNIVAAIDRMIWSRSGGTGSTQ